MVSRWLNTHNLDVRTSSINFQMQSQTFGINDPQTFDILDMADGSTPTRHGPWPVSQPLLSSTSALQLLLCPAPGIFRRFMETSGFLRRRRGSQGRVAGKKQCPWLWYWSVDLGIGPSQTRLNKRLKKGQSASLFHHVHFLENTGSISPVPSFRFHLPSGGSAHRAGGIRSDPPSSSPFGHASSSALTAP